MEIPHEATLLRIFIGESDRYEHRPLYEAIILKAREMQLAGATALRGPMGFGKSSRMHTSKILRLSMDLPMIIEIIDSEAPSFGKSILEHDPNGTGARAYRALAKEFIERHR